MELIVNPKTKRLIKPGTKLYNKLVREQELMEKVYPDLYALGGSGHELWTLIVLYSDFSFLPTLSHVNKFTNKFIYDKIPLNKWIDYVIKRNWKNHHKKEFSFMNLRNETVRGNSKFRKTFINWWRCMNDIMRYAFIQYLSDHLLLTFNPNPVLNIHGTMIEDWCSKDIKELSKCLFYFDRANKALYYYSSINVGSKKLDNADQVVIVDKRNPQPGNDYFSYIKTHRIENGKSVYLCLSIFHTSGINVTEYFDDIW